MNGPTVCNDTHDQTAQLRALLFTDLCDSVALVERVGDAAAAELFQQHDRLVLGLQQRWNGQLIDRSDGLFLLFERPLDALGFALDYHQGLHELGEQASVELSVRAGLHVGEVIVWKNAADAVALGAKQVEVEGLAKPMAARLMQLARPGQLLVSATAESMVRRSAARMSEGPQALQWKSCGRWRFKGVAQPMEVFAVHSPGMPKTRQPRQSDKATRDIPLWRRPLAMVAQATLALSLLVGGWFLTRSQPAIAFAERDWVVLADTQNLTENELLGEGLTLAFRVSLEQSRYVNVLSDLKARETLSRMMLPEGAPLDRVAAVQVASREGARAVLIPNVREVQGKLRVSVDVLEPSTNQVVYSVHSDGNGYGSALSSTDEVVVQLRSRLGEALTDVRKASAPLPNVTTADLDALNAYAKGVAAYGKGHSVDSIKFFDIALGIDQSFAMAWLGKMRALASLGNREDARTALQQAKQYRDRLTTREALYMDAWALDMLSDSEAAALDAWKTLATLYPDHYGANANLALAAFAMGQIQDAAVAAQRTNAPQNGMRVIALHLIGRIQLAAGQVEQAIATLRDAAAQSDGTSSRYLVGALAAAGRQQEAVLQLRTLPADSTAYWLEAVSLDIDQGNHEAAAKRAEASARACTDTTLVCAWLATVAVAADAAAGQCVADQQLDARLKPLLSALAEPNADDRGQRLFYAAAMVYAGQRMGADRWASRQLPALAGLAADVDDAKSAELIQVLHAYNEHLQGNTAAAITRLKSLITGHELYQVHGALASLHAAGQDAEALSASNRWLSDHRGLAYAEYSGSSVLQPINVRDSKGRAFPRACRAAPASAAALH